MRIRMPGDQEQQEKAPPSKFEDVMDLRVPHPRFLRVGLFLSVWWVLHFRMFSSSLSLRARVLLQSGKPRVLQLDRGSIHAGTECKAATLFWYSCALARISFSFSVNIRRSSITNFPLITTVLTSEPFKA